MSPLPVARSYSSIGGHYENPNAYYCHQKNGLIAADLGIMWLASYFDVRKGLIFGVPSNISFDSKFMMALASSNPPPVVLSYGDWLLPQLLAIDDGEEGKFRERWRTLLRVKWSEQLQFEFPDLFVRHFTLSSGITVDQDRKPPRYTSADLKTEVIVSRYTLSDLMACMDDKHLDHLSQLMSVNERSALRDWLLANLCTKEMVEKCLQLYRTSAPKSSASFLVGPGPLPDGVTEHDKSCCTCRLCVGWSLKLRSRRSRSRSRSLSPIKRRDRSRSRSRRRSPSPLGDASFEPMMPKSPAYSPTSLSYSYEPREPTHPSYDPTQYKPSKKHRRRD